MLRVCAHTLSTTLSKPHTNKHTHTTARCARPNQVNVNVHQLESEGGRGWGGIGQEDTGELENVMGSESRRESDGVWVRLEN